MNWDIASPPPRVLARPDDASRAFWTSGARDELVVSRCTRCARCCFPPSGICVHCQSPTEAVRAAGDGTVFSYTVCHKQFHPAVPTPLVVALVELDGFPESRMVTNIVSCDPASVHRGMRVSVRFEQHDDLHVPVFVPADQPPA